MWFHQSFLNEKSLKARKLDDMIVVASLIEKVPNMGGLAKTCLSLGISGLVIPSLVHIDSDEF